MCNTLRGGVSLTHRAHPRILLFEKWRSVDNSISRTDIGERFFRFSCSPMHVLFWRFSSAGDPRVFNSLCEVEDCRCLRGARTMVGQTRKWQAQEGWHRVSLRFFSVAWHGTKPQLAPSQQHGLLRVQAVRLGVHRYKLIYHGLHYQSIGK
jgi:hypothetical protein